MRFNVLPLVLTAGLTSVCANAGVLTYGDKDCLQQNCYGAAEPTTGATLEGLTPGAITLATNLFGHGFPFVPDAGDFAGTDQIYVGSSQTGAHDGYSVETSRHAGPQVLTLDYSSLIPGGQTLSTLTLGIAADDFQNPALGQPFTASINGTVNTELTNQLNSLDQGGPIVQFLTIGLSSSVDNSAHTLTLSIDNGGDGGDGWAVDFLTVGVTTAGPSAVAEPSSFIATALGLCGVLVGIIRRRR